MNINLAILYDELSDRNVQLLTSHPIQELDIACILFLPEDTTQLKKEELYICRANQIPLLESDIPLNLAVIGEIEPSLLLDAGYQALLFTEYISPSVLSNRLQQIKTAYDQWDNEMLQAVLDKSPRQKILDIGMRHYHNPVAFFDREFGLAMTAGELPENPAGTIWEYVLKNRFSPADSLYPAQRASVMKRFFENEWPFIYRAAITKETYMNCSIVNDGILYGTFAATAIHPFTEGQCAILYCIARRIKQSLLHTINDYGTGIDLPFFLHRILSGIEIEENVILYHLNQIRWQVSDYFRVYRLEPEDHTPLSQGECAVYRNPLKRIFPDSLIMQYENGLLIVTHARGSHPIPDPLEDFLEHHRLHVGISMEFHDFMYIKYAYIQCKHALNTGAKKSEFARHYIECLMSRLTQITSLKSFCHPLLLQLYLQGSEKDRLFIESMKVYIENGRSLSDASRKLGIHRNTLTYRLQSMNQYLGIDLFSDTLSEDFLTLLTFSSLILKNL